MKLDAMKRADVADVWLPGRRCARLVRAKEGIEFAYEDGYSGAPVATTLPIDGEATRTAGGAVPPFFAGLLPEGRRLAAIRRATKTSADDDLTMLLAVGQDTVGNVQVVPHGEKPKLSAVLAVAQPAEIEFAELFESVLTPANLDRAAIPGVQDKVSGRMIALPVTHAGASWILKLDPPEFPHLVANEAFFLAAARSSGLDVAHAEVVVDKVGRQGLLVRRFDRVQVDGDLAALAQEDACQALGRYPADKYRVTTEQVIVGLARLTHAPLVAARTLLRQFAFAYLTGNGDAHAKNFSLLHRDGEWRVAPAYDLPSTHPYGDTTMALSIQGRSREDIRRADFVQLGEQCGVPEKATKRVLDDLLAAMPLWFDRLGELPLDPRKVHKLAQACRYRASRLRGR